MGGSYWRVSRDRIMCVCVCVVMWGGRSFGLHTSKVRAKDRGHTYSLHRTHMGVPHVDCEGPCAVTQTNPLLPPGRKAPETCLHQESNRVPRVLSAGSKTGGCNTCFLLAISGCDSYGMQQFHKLFSSKTGSLWSEPHGPPCNSHQSKNQNKLAWASCSLEPGKVTCDTTQV